MVEINEEIVEKVKAWLGSEGIQHFKNYKKHYGTVSPVIPGNPPHPVHLREGMGVRNFLRTIPECSDWDTHDFDNNWAAVVEVAIKEGGSSGGE